jgi:hypothetical protein
MVEDSVLFYPEYGSSKFLRNIYNHLQTELRHTSGHGGPKAARHTFDKPYTRVISPAERRSSKHTETSIVLHIRTKYVKSCY